MGHDIPGKFIGLMLAFILTVVTPFVNTTVELEMLDRRSIITDVTNFIDEVVDSRQITDAMLKELNSNLASYGVTVDYEITHLKRDVNPDPLEPGSYYTSYIPVGDTVPWEKGDRISVRVRTVGYSTTQTLAHRLVGMFVSELDRTIVARIR